MVKNILITGGAGYIGSHTAEILINNNKKVFIVDDLSTGYKKLILKKTKFYKTSILNKKKLRNIIVQNNIDSIIHLAAVLSVGESEKKPKKYNKINIEGTKKLLESIKNTKVKLLLQPEDLIHDDQSKLKLEVVDRKFRGTNFIYTLKTKKGEHLPVFVHSHHIHQHEKSEQFGVKSPIYIDHLVCF